MRTWKSLRCLTGNHPILTISLMSFTYLFRTKLAAILAGHVVNVLVEIPAKGNRQCHNSQVLTAPVTPLSAF